MSGRTPEQELMEALRRLLRDAPVGLSCDHFHHGKKDQHQWFEDCAPLNRWQEAKTNARRAIARATGEQP